MCLSTVFLTEGDTETLVARQVSGISVVGDGVVLKDIMGRETTVKGCITSIDLVKNTVYIA